MKKLLSLLILTGTLFAQANDIFTLNPSVSSAGMGNVGIAHADVKMYFTIQLLQDLTKDTKRYHMLIGCQILLMIWDIKVFYILRH